MSKMGRPSIWAAHRDEMVRLYTEEKWSRGQIARHLGTSAVTVTRQLRAAGVKFEGRTGDNPNDSRTPERRAEIAAKISESRKGKGTGPRVEREQRVCERCKNSYIYVPGRTGERFCSRSCSVSATTEDHTQSVRSAYASDPVLCSCGTTIPYEYRNTRQFCSPECRFTYGAKRQSDPEKQVTFDCQNCGKAVTRYKHYGNGYNKYCSNACAMKHTKTKVHIVMNDDSVVLDSKWEALFWGICGLYRVSCERLDRQRGVEWQPGRWYGPDFWLPTLNLAVEIKGLEDAEDALRWASYRQQRGLLVVLDKDGLGGLTSSSDPEKYLLAIAAEQAGIE